MHLWAMMNWKKYVTNRRAGLRLVFDKEVHPEVRKLLKDFAKWMRQEYYFPVRVPIYIKASERIKAMDGDWVCGTFFRPSDYECEPYIRIAVGDYEYLLNKWGKRDALLTYVGSTAHELTHYFQWLNKLELTLIGEERQATRYAKFILYEYGDSRDEFENL